MNFASSKFNCRKKLKSEVWWLKPVIPALMEAEARELPGV